jgi:hypothetical protein
LRLEYSRLPAWFWSHIHPYQWTCFFSPMCKSCMSHQTMFVQHLFPFDFPLLNSKWTCSVLQFLLLNKCSMKLLAYAWHRGFLLVWGVPKKERSQVSCPYAGLYDQWQLYKMRFCNISHILTWFMVPSTPNWF